MILNAPCTVDHAAQNVVNVELEARCASLEARLAQEQAQLARQRDVGPVATLYGHCDCASVGLLCPEPLGRTNTDDDGVQEGRSAILKAHHYEARAATLEQVLRSFSVGDDADVV